MLKLSVGILLRIIVVKKHWKAILSPSLLWLLKILNSIRTLDQINISHLIVLILKPKVSQKKNSFEG